MVKIQKHIEIVRSSIPSLSSMSQRSCDAISAVLSEHYTRVGITIVNDLSDLERLVAERPDLVFLGMKFVPLDPELGLQDPIKIWITEYLDEHGLTYTGSKQNAHELEFNKPLAKQCVIDAGLETSPFCVFEQDMKSASDQIPLEFPVFIKPTNRGGGQGINSDSIAYNMSDLQAKVQSIANNLQADSLIEEYLPGREFSVAILKDKQTAKYLVMPIEKVAPLDKRGERILSQQVKSADSVCDLEVKDQIIRAKLISLAIDVFHTLGARDYGRIDIRLDKTGTPQFLEANLLPSLIKGYGSFPKACMLNLGLDYEAMILHIVNLGLVRLTNIDQNPADIDNPTVSVLTLSSRN